MPMTARQVELGPVAVQINGDGIVPVQDRQVVPLVVSDFLADSGDDVAAAQVGVDGNRSVDQGHGYVMVIGRFAARVEQSGIVEMRLQEEIWDGFLEGFFEKTTLCFMESQISPIAMNFFHFLKIFLDSACHFSNARTSYSKINFQGLQLQFNHWKLEKYELHFQ